MTTSKFLRNEEGCNNGHGTLSNAYHCTFHSTKHLCANATDEKHDQYRLIGTLLRSVPKKLNFSNKKHTFSFLMEILALTEKNTQNLTQEQDAMSF